MAQDFSSAAALIGEAWRLDHSLPDLPTGVRPKTRAEGYEVQRALAGQFGPVIGWKIAATSEAGQRHIGVSQPLAGRLFQDRQRTVATTVSLKGNRMLVVEPEFAFRFRHRILPHALPARAQDLVDAIESLHLAIEIPNSRFEDFARAGEPQLVADNACAHDFIIGPAVTVDWRAMDLAAHPVAIRHGGAQHNGFGRNVYGGPLIALEWLVREVASLDLAIEAGHVVMTGTAAPPLPVSPGDQVVADFGHLGSISVRLTA